MGCAFCFDFEHKKARKLLYRLTCPRSRRRRRLTNLVVVEVYETDQDLVVKAELPGVKKENVEVSIRDNALHIKHKRRQKHYNL